MDIFFDFLKTTGFAQMEPGNAIMILIGIAFITLAIRKDYEPLLLVPIGFGIIVGNIPYVTTMSLGVYDDWRPIVEGGKGSLQQASVLSYIYFGVKYGLFPPLIFLGIGAMTDFSTMLSNPKLVLLGAAAQIGVFLTFLGALLLEFTPAQAASIGIIGGADGPTAIFLSSQLAPEMLGAIAISAYSYMALVPVIQPPIMRLLTTREERLIRMKPPREVSKRERMIFPVAAFLICALIAPGALTLLGMLFFGNLLKESTVTNRLAETARHALIDMVTILLGVAVGASTQARTFLVKDSLMIFAPGGGLVCHCDRRRGAVCQVHEPVSDGKDQPADRSGGGVGGARFGPRGPNGRTEGRPAQHAADARHGSERGGSHRLGHRRRSDVERTGEVTAETRVEGQETRGRPCFGSRNWMSGKSQFDLPIACMK